MRKFTTMQVREAKAYAATGGQALHLHKIIVNRHAAPRCFLDALDRDEEIAHLFDRDVDRLEATARRLGVIQICVHHEGDPNRQHIDLCGKPLRRAIRECQRNGHHDDPMGQPAGLGG